MTQIYSASPARTLDQLTAALAQSKPASVAIWTFDDRPARQAAEAALAALGIAAKVRSAYKPLVHFFLEDARPGFTAAAITYPVHPGAVANRFLLESYPLGALLPVQPTFAPGTADLHYDVTLTYPEGPETHRVFAPNREHIDHVGETLLSPCGWVDDAPYETDYEQIFTGLIASIKAYPWPQAEPYFDQLVIDVTLPAADEPLPYDDEVISLTEAMHEEIYFSLLEVFQRHSGRPLGDRHLQPGQIVPVVRTGVAPSINVTLQPLTTVDRAGAPQPLETAAAALPVAQVRDTLAALGGTPFTAQTRSGRTVDASYVAGAGYPVMISAGQHANETTGIVGALRAANRLRAAGGSFTISPLENPDGYALHGLLCADNPRHMHHAARYTALGDDLEYRENPETYYEKAIRIEAENRSGALLHVNLHGYPAHEWTRPLSGYVPRNFAMWTVPKGFFLVLRHHPAFADTARKLIDAVTRDLGDVPGLTDYNRRQIALYELHAGETGFEMINGFPCYVHSDDRHRVPLTLITEYPDETVYGDAFIAGHTAQMQTVLSAHAAWQRLAPSLPLS
ncbi:hypothetical protein BVG79_p1000190 (plasmid) [Ketogulonicigenium robustum]|uniref:Peptidase M14 n=1 Tax=Ketogulonicigenium robustum TaxID=92947 RepID=A0A1W6P3B8_9RHOB|nr:peptidase M14 [Ketogulonicigenium robustum]ARO15992.1 hypothetical protein BVG79_p1000190 [Ketogulonicigenium robustum]